MPLYHHEPIILTTLSGQPALSRSFQSPLRLYRVKSFGGIDEHHDGSRFCSLHFSWTCLAAYSISVVPLPDLKQHWLSEKILSRWVLPILTSLPVITKITGRDGALDGVLVGDRRYACRAYLPKSAGEVH